MKKLLFALLALLCPLAWSNTILVLGDSISAAYGIPVESGWVNLLQQKLNQQYPARYDVVNASISGDTTAGGLQRLPLLLETHNPDQVVVELGGNDGLRGLPLKQMESNLHKIVNLSRESGAEVVLVGIELPPSYGVIFNRRFTRVFETLEDSLNVPRVSLGYSHLGDSSFLQADGIHPTEAAQPILLDLIWPLIKRQ